MAYLNQRVLGDEFTEFEYVTPTWIQVNYHPGLTPTHDYIEFVIEPLQTKSWAFIPLFNASVGNHWALAVYQVSSESFYYFDSLPGDANLQEKCAMLLRLIRKSKGAVMPDSTWFMLLSRRN